MSEQKKIVLVSAGLLSATIIAFIVGVYLSNLPKYYRLSENAVETQGKVISKESHAHISFEYQVNNQKFKSGGRTSFINKDFESVQLNDMVSVYYDPSAPEDAILGSPDEHLKSGFVETGVITFIPILLFGIYKIKSIANAETE